MQREKDKQTFFKKLGRDQTLFSETKAQDRDKSK